MGISRRIMNAGRISFIILIPILVLVVGPDITMGGSISGTADMTYNKYSFVKNEKKTDSSSLSQSYNLNLNKSLTSTINFSGNIRVIITDRDGEKDTRYSPQIFLNYNSPFPEYFSLSMSYNRRENHLQSSADLATDTFNTTFSIPSVREWLPSLSVSYNKTETKDDLSPRTTDTTTSSIGVSSAYDFRFKDAPVNLLYSHNMSNSENNIESTVSESFNDQGNVNFSRSFWNNRIDLGGNFGLSRSENIQESLTGPRLFDETKVPSQGLYSDNPPDPINVALTSTPDLINNNKSTPVTGIDLNNVNQNIGLGFTAPQKIHKIYLYTDSAPNSFLTWTWELYTSSDNITWAKTNNSPSVAYGTTFNGFILTFFTTVEARYFKVINTSIATSTLNVTEIEAIGNITETPKETLKTVTTRDFVGFNLSFNATDKAIFSYFFNYSHSDSENKANSSDILSVSQNVGLSYIIYPQYLTLTTNYSTQTSKPSEGDKSGSNAYSLSLSTVLLPTVNGSLATGYSESVLGGKVQSTSNNITASIFMELYKGIDLRVGTGMSSSENKASASTTDSSSISTDLKLIPWNPLQIVLRNGYSSSRTEGAGGDTKASASSFRADILYSASRNIYIAAYFNVEPEFYQNYSVSWRPTQKIQTGFNYSISVSDTKSFASSINWMPLRRLSLRTSYNLSKEKNNDRVTSFLLAVSVRL
ncbi:MAG: hypothetical protein ACE5IH_00195 [Thermodesulfobacteriota bacterium]